MEANLIARVVGILLVVIAALFAIERMALAPLRCARAAHRESSSEIVACPCTRDVAEVCTARAVMLKSPSEAKTAIAHWRRALEVERRPEIYFAMGMDALEAFDRPLAIDSFTRACTFDPARLNDIPYADIRTVVRNRIVAAYGEPWLR